MRFIYLVLFGLFIGQNAFGVSLYVPTNKPDCMVFSINHEDSWSYKWSGKCVNGKASGKGVMEINRPDIQWTRTSTYVDGHAVGFGTFKNSNGTSMVGEFSNDLLSGFATLTISKLDKHLISWWEEQNAGKWISGSYVVQGIIEQSKLVLSCPNEKTCREILQRKMLQDQIAANEASNRQSRGGVKAVRYLEATKSIGIECNDRYLTTLDKNSSGEWCERSRAGSYQCFRSEHQTAQHVCQ